MIFGGKGDLWTSLECALSLELLTNDEKKMRAYIEE
jgi:hypothetical protein